MLSTDTSLLSDDFSGWEVRLMKNSDRPVAAAGPLSQADVEAAAVSRLCDQVRHSPLPVNLIRLSDGQTLEVSDELVTLTRMDRESLLTKRVADYTEEPEVASASFALLASGALDSYTRKASFRRPDGEVVTFSVWVGACKETQPPRHAVATILLTSNTSDLPAVHDDTSDTDNLMFGTIDAHWRIDRITGADDPVLAYRPEQMLGNSAFIAIHPEDVGSGVLLAAHSTVRKSATFGRIRIAGRDGGWVTRRVSLQPLVGEGSSGFAFTICREGSPPREADPSMNATEGLSAALQEIDADRKASGLAAWMAAFPTALRVPELSSLTAREYEIVLRLAFGDRVRSIAGDLHLSQSTVRNHLTAVFRKFNVRSQTELLARLRPASETAARQQSAGNAVLNRFTTDT
jgi:DNA-binding CsgD family transcriptional regulator